MALVRRQKVILISLLLYWPAIFVLAHIPVPKFFHGAHVSDKTLHYIAYFVLVFLLWFALGPGSKVKWRRPAVWCVLFVVVCYGVLDEWLQGYVGRDADVVDFFADLAGALTGLILLTIFSFWPAALAGAAATIFVLANFMRGGLADVMPLTSMMFLLFAYGLFSLLWTGYMPGLLPLKAPEPRWLIGALSLPLGLLLVVELFSALVGNDFRLSHVAVSVAGIAVVIMALYLVALFRRGSAEGLPPY
ncbi:MAG: VanZ family protein [Planctomycetota bacterium]|nr:MAG: VanZ family protein [Planctomycetota bacterium]